VSASHALAAVPYSERPELIDDRGVPSADVWPEYNLHGDVLNPLWPRLFELFPDCQLALYDAERDEVVAEAHTAPIRWDGTVAGLGDGIDAALLAAVEPGPRRPATALCAMAAEIRPSHQGRGLAVRVLAAMADLARARGLPHLLAPVRPSLKERYPLVPIERYAAWEVPGGGAPFDPWLRVHARIGGRVAAPAPRSMRITGTVGDWESWVEMAFPDDGDYPFPRGLAPVTIDHARDLGAYWEPNVWVVHRLSAEGR
jgi:GNAT superfamily N-acetyltransferase